MATAAERCPNKGNQSLERKPPTIAVQPQHLKPIHDSDPAEEVIISVLHQYDLYLNYPCEFSIGFFTWNNRISSFQCISPTDWLNEEAFRREANRFRFKLVVDSHSSETKFEERKSKRRRSKKSKVCNVFSGPCSLDKKTQVRKLSFRGKKLAAVLVAQTESFPAMAAKRGLPRRPSDTRAGSEGRAGGTVNPAFPDRGPGKALFKFKCTKFPLTQLRHCFGKFLCLAKNFVCGDGKTSAYYLNIILICTECLNICHGRIMPPSNAVFEICRKVDFAKPLPLFTLLELSHPPPLSCMCIKWSRGNFYLYDSLQIILRIVELTP